MKDNAMDWRERKALEKLAEGFVEEESGLPRGVGRETLEKLLEQRWIERATCATYGTVGYKITESGRTALYGR